MSGTLSSMPHAHHRALHLTLVRHGESSWNESRIIQGQLDGAVLTSTGREQITLAAQALRDEHFDAIIASDLARAVESAAILAEALGLEVTQDSALRERSFGVLEGGPISATTPHLTGIDEGRVIDDLARPERGESLRELLERAGQFVQRSLAEHSGQRLLIVTHGGTIRAIRAYVAGASFAGSEWYAVDNASRWRVVVDGV